jgi:DNA-binding beta-propeller fold protein YncE
MSCGGSGTTPRCDEPHRLARFRGDSTLPVLSPEPFDVAVDVPGQNVFVTHLTTGEVTLVSAPIEVGSTPVLEDSIASLWALNRVSLTVGAVGIAPRLPGDPRGLVYVTSRAEARVAMVHVVPGPPTSTGQPTEALVRSGSFFYNGLESNGLPGDARNIAFSADGNRAYLVNRTPPSLQVYDTSIDDTGQPVNQFLGGVTVCSLPATVSLADFGEGLRAAIPCFLTGEVWILDPERRELISVEDAGRGPNGIAASTRHRKLYVGNYAEDTLMVIDVAPGSRMQNRAVLRLGQPRPLGNQ